MNAISFIYWSTDSILASIVEDEDGFQYFINDTNRYFRIYKECSSLSPHCYSVSMQKPCFYVSIQTSLSIEQLCDFLQRLSFDYCLEIKTRFADARRCLTGTLHIQNGLKCDSSEFRTLVNDIGSFFYGITCFDMDEEDY